ncbi:MAG: hypothetical protein KDH94_04405, partial [Coxiellaceae bacterium]|nr:hypothetical protein [Coxiellaceae bacterium]
YDYFHPNKRIPEGPGIYTMSFGLGLSAAIIGLVTTHNFQGQKIGEPEEEPHKKPTYVKGDAPHNSKSSMLEAGYLFFALTLSISNNYIMTAGLVPFVHNSNLPIAPPGWGGMLFFLFKALVCDIPFDGASANFEACEEIKYKFTYAKEETHISKLFKPIAVRPKLLSAYLNWTQSAGVISHTGTDILGLVLSAPPLISMIFKLSSNFDTWNDFSSTPQIFWPTFIISIILFAINCPQSLFFECEEIENNLKKIREANSPLTPYSYLHEKEIPTNPMHKFLLFSPKIKKPLKILFNTQGFLHAFGDLMPVLLLLRDMVDRHGENSSPSSIALISTVSAIAFIGSWLGTHFSEVITAQERLDKFYETHLTSPAV